MSDPDFPFAGLRERYRLSLPSVYARMAACGVESFKRSRRAYITAKQLEILDALDLHLSRGGLFSDFPGSVNQKLPVSLGVAPDLSPQEVLQGFVDSGFGITTSEISQLTHAKIRGTNFKWGVFSFTVVGKMGKYNAWKVTRDG